MDEPLPLALPARQNIACLGRAEDVLESTKKMPLPLGAASSLKELETEFHFFSPALLYMSGSFSDVIWIDYQKSIGRVLPIFYHQFQTQVFNGLHTQSGDVAWNHSLWAVHKHEWEGVTHWITNSVIADFSTKQVLIFGEQDTTINDPLMSDKKSLAIEKVVVSFFGLRYVNSTYMVEDDPVFPYLKCFPPDPRVKVYAERLAAYANPTVAFEDFSRFNPRS
jgi:hypothetical protein